MSDLSLADTIVQALTGTPPPTQPDPLAAQVLLFTATILPGDAARGTRPILVSLTIPGSAYTPLTLSTTFDNLLGALDATWSALALHVEQSGVPAQDDPAKDDDSADKDSASRPVSTPKKPQPAPTPQIPLF